MLKKELTIKVKLIIGFLIAGLIPTIIVSLLLVFNAASSLHHEACVRSRPWPRHVGGYP